MIITKKICIIHAGDVDYETRISPRGQIRGKFWIGPERNRYWCGVYGFTHIGIHAHEFGHTLGLHHTAGTEWNTIDENGDTVLTDLMALTSKYWDVMLNGNVNGPYKDAACPAGFNPVYKIWHNWIDASDTVHISHDTSNLCIEYNYNSSKYYIVNRNHGIVGGEYYILENRQRSGWDKYTPIKPDYIAEPNDANANEGGLLIYKVQELYPNVMWGMNLNAGNVIGDQFKDTDWEQYQNAYCRAPFPLNQGQSINDYTIPNTNFYNIVNNYRYRDTCGVRNSNYAFHNIVWDSNTKTVTLDVITDFDNTWSGNITSDVEWSGNVKVVDDITINSGVTLTIAAGTTVEMSPDTRIYSDGGNLLINGTITDSVYVTPDVASTANREYYYGFLIKNADVDASYLKMDHSERGILTINSKTIVKNSVFEDGWFDGVYLKNCLSGSEISDCRFDNINYYGIYYSGGVNTNIYSNIFTGIGNSGLQLHTFNGSIGKNEFYDGNNDGIRFLSSSSGSMIRFYFTGYTDPFDIYNNKFLNNNSDAIYIDATSTPQVGANIQSGTDTYYRGLNVLSKGSTGDYLVYSLNSATIDARCNYWDTYPIGLNYGSVNHNPPMQYFIPSNAFAKSINGLENDEEIIENKYDRFIAVGDSLQCIEKYKEAIIEYKKVLNLINDIPQSLIALNRIVSTYLIIEERDELKEYLIYLFEHTSSYLEGSILTHLARCFDFGTFDRKSMLTLKEAILAFDDAENYEAAGMLILDYLEALGIEDEVKSSNLSKEMKHEEEMYFEELLLRKYSETEAANIYSEFSKDEQEVMLPEQIELLPVYPNPFNPKVNIPFKLSKTASVRIIIFDISGKKIWEKSARNFHAGAHTIQWNGYSTSSQPVSSGVYIVKLLVDNMMFTQKMILLK